MAALMHGWVQNGLACGTVSKTYNVTEEYRYIVLAFFNTSLPDTPPAPVTKTEKADSSVSFHHLKAERDSNLILSILSATQDQLRTEREGWGEGGGRSNSKTLFYKDCSLDSVKICLTTSPCLNLSNN